MNSSLHPIPSFPAHFCADITYPWITDYHDTTIMLITSVVRTGPRGEIPGGPRRLQKELPGSQEGDPRRRQGRLQEAPGGRPRLQVLRCFKRARGRSEAPGAIRIKEQ